MGILRRGRTPLGAQYRSPLGAFSRGSFPPPTIAVWHEDGTIEKYAGETLAVAGTVATIAADSASWITFDFDGELYLSLTDNTYNRYRYGNLGTLLWRISPGGNPTERRHVNPLPNGNMLSATGEFAKSDGSLVWSTGTFGAPDCDANGNVWIRNLTTNQITKYDTGRSTVWTASAGAYGFGNQTGGIAVAPNGTAATDQTSGGSNFARMFDANDGSTTDVAIDSGVQMLAPSVNRAGTFATLTRNAANTEWNLYTFTAAGATLIDSGSLGSPKFLSRAVIDNNGDIYFVTANGANDCIIHRRGPSGSLDEDVARPFGQISQSHMKTVI